MKKFSQYTDVELFDSFGAKPKIAQPAFAEFYSRYSDLLWNYIKKFLGINEDVSDLFQDIIVSFYESGKKKKGKISNPKSFLYMTARNKSINYIRDKRNFSEFTEGTYNRNEFDYGDKHLTELIQKEIEQMDFLDRDLLILKYYQDWSIREIAKYYKKDEQYIRNKIWRARKKLISQLQPFLKEIKTINKIVLE